MTNSLEKALESSTKAQYLTIIITTLGLIYVCTYCIISDIYTDTQIHMLKGILSTTIPITIGLAACYFASHIKTQKQWYIRAISYTSCILLTVTLCMGILNIIEKFIPFVYPWMYYLLPATLIIAFSIMEMHNYNNTIKKHMNTHSKKT